MRKRCFFLALVCLLLLFPNIVWSLAITNPSPIDKAEIDGVQNNVDLSWQSDFTPTEFYVELWQIKDNNQIFIAQSIVKQPQYSLLQPIRAGEYFWQVSAENDGQKVISPVWSFYCKPWFHFFADNTSLLLLTRYPGEFQMKWTKVILEANVNIRLVFNEIILKNENGQIVPAIFGLKQGESKVVWQSGQWSIFFECPLSAQEFEIWLKVKANEKVSAGNYKAIIKAHVLMEP